MPRLVYPLEQENRLLRSKIVFSVFEVDPPEFVGGQNLINTVRDAYNDVFSEGANVGTSGDQFGQEFGSGNKTEVKAMAIDPIPGARVELFIPVAFQVNEGMQYDTTNLGISGAGTVAGLNAGSGALGSALRGIFSGAQSLGGLFGLGEGGAGLAARLSASRLASTPVGFLVPQGVRDAIGIVGRVTVNPNTRTAFRGVNIREFQFQFKFLPKSSRESEAVKEIIRLFRRHMYPEEIPSGSNFPLGYKYPDLFKIRLLSGKSSGDRFENIGTPIKMSYLRAVATTYNPTSSALNEDGSPTEIDLTLSFVEYKTLSRYDVDNEDKVGFYEYYGKLPPQKDQSSTRM